MSPGIYGSSDDAEGIATICAVVNAGVTLIDTAISTAWVIKDVGPCRPQTKLRLPRVSFVSGPSLSYRIFKTMTRSLLGSVTGRSLLTCSAVTPTAALPQAPRTKLSTSPIASSFN
jgi:hypothetical protein